MPIRHLPFTTRPVYRLKLSLPALRTQAARGRSAGFYNLSTLWYFRKAWLASKSPQDYLKYLLFRRDLGYPLNTARANEVSALLNRSLVFRARHRLIGHRARQLRNLLDEYQQSANNPAVAKDELHRVMRWRASQSQWRGEFEQTMRTSKHIAVVGNAPSLREQGNGSAIDSADQVVRFNRFQSEHTRPEDTGERLDVWAMAPGFKGIVPDCRWVLLTGPDMLWRQQRFEPLHHRAGTVLSIPLAHWRGLVRTLAAPPSAGLLTIAYLLTVVEKKNLALYGFSFTAEAANQYHHTDPTHKPVARHNWAAERLWLQKEFRSSYENRKPLS